MITATLHFAIAGSVVRGLLCVLFILFSCCIFLISSVLTKKIAYDRLIRCFRPADMFKSEKQYMHSSASSILMQDSQTKAKTPRCVCVRCIMHVVEFHYVPQPQQSLGLSELGGRYDCPLWNCSPRIAPDTPNASHQTTVTRGLITSQLWSFPVREWERLLIVNRSLYHVDVSRRHLRWIYGTNHDGCQKIQTAKLLSCLDRQIVWIE